MFRVAIERGNLFCALRNAGALLSRLKRLLSFLAARGRRRHGQLVRYIRNYYPRKV